jgi:potassium voltage-gated channel Eag-related subfamily H protein 8
VWIRQGRSTLDYLVRVETFIRNAFAKKEHAVSIVFDREKVYYTAWKYGILKDLFDMGLKGNLSTFISKCNREDASLGNSHLLFLNVRIS